MAAATRRAKARLTALGVLGDDDHSDTDSDDEKGAKASSTLKGKKSGKVKTADHKTKHDIDWPHYYVFRDAKGVAYEQLTIAEFSFGFHNMIDNAAPRQQKWLLSHFKDLMEDAMQYKWYVVRDFNYVVFQMIETARLNLVPTHSDMTKILDLRRQHIWNKPNAYMSRTHTPRPDYHHTSRPDYSKQQGHTAAPHDNTPCEAFQRRACEHMGSHDGVDHVCAYCMKLSAGSFPHPEALCRRKHWHWEKNGKLEA